MDSLSVTAVVIVALLVANGFFVAAEFALVKARGFRLEALAGADEFGARLARRIQRDLEAYLAACQLGITMASLGLGWVGEPAVAHVLEPLFRRLALPEPSVHTVSFLLGFVIFSSLHIVIGEQVPKTFAIRKPEPVSLAIAYPLQGFYLLAYPLNWLLNAASSAILARFGVEQATHGEVLTSEELRTLVTTSHEAGAMENQKAQMLSNIFAFDARTVGRVMIPRADVAVLGLGAAPAANAAVVTATGHSRFPVVEAESDTPVGVVLVKELYGALLATGEMPWERLREFCRAPLVVPETMRIAELFESMRKDRGHMALVVDEYGTFIGMATLEDLLEEIVGEIADELETAAERYDVVPDGSGWLCDGLLSLADLERAVGLAVPDELDANTVSGLFLVRLARMPEAGDVVEEGGYRLEVLEMAAHHVSKVRIEPRFLSSPERAPGDAPRSA